MDAYKLNFKGSKALVAKAAIEVTRGGGQIDLNILVNSDLPSEVICCKS